MKAELACGVPPNSTLSHRLAAMMIPVAKAHGLRHTHAAELREEGLDIGIVRKQLGHSSISTAAHDFDHIASRAVVVAIVGRRW